MISVSLSVLLLALNVMYHKFLTAHLLDVMFSFPVVSRFIISLLNLLLPTCFSAKRARY